MNTKLYNTTDLDPQKTFERHVFHRDQFAHYLRWSHMLKKIKKNQVICDFGCGKGNLCEVLYRNRVIPREYIGLDIKNKFNERLIKLDWVKFFQEDLVNPQNNIDFHQFNADHVCSFEVIEHVGKQNAKVFLKNFKSCGSLNAIYYLSTPNYDKKVGAAANHTYDSGDGNGISIQEFDHFELQEIILSCGFEIIKKYGTFASIKDYYVLMNEWQKKMYNNLKEYYDSNVLSNLMAPFFPEQSRNTLWVMRSKSSINEINFK